MTIGIDDGKFYLIDNFPGLPTQGLNPADFTTVYSTIPSGFQLGSKRMIYDETNKGWSILAFLKYNKGTAAAVAVKGICAQETATVAAAASWFNVTNDGGESYLNGPIAIALATMADGEYGWFWVGGVCPVATIPGLDGIFPGAAAGTIVAQVGMKLIDSASYNKFTVMTASTMGLMSAFAMDADTTS